MHEIVEVILSSLFDKDGDGFLSTEEMQKILTKSGEKISHKEVLEMVEESDGCMDYRGEDEVCSFKCIHFYIFHHVIFSSQHCLFQNSAQDCSMI